MAGDTIKTRKYYVTMTDRFMSGWGMAKGTTNKFVIGTDDYDRAKYLYEKALNRPEMRYVNLNITKPHYGSGVYVSYRDAEDIRW